jgi:hypothetical protein
MEIGERAGALKTSEVSLLGAVMTGAAVMAARRRGRGIRGAADLPHRRGWRAGDGQHGGALRAHLNSATAPDVAVASAVGS